MPQTDLQLLPTLEGERINLRWLTVADIPALFAIFGDPQVTRFWASPALRDEAAAAELLAEIHENVRTRKGFQWGIARRADDVVIGTCTLYQPDFRHQRSEIGFALARECWGQGYASEALRLALAHAFDVLGFRRIEADVDPRNDASLRALERLGFVREGYLRERYNVDGEIQDSVYLGLLRADWTGAGAAS
jgi:RimJ/RimL family protein N-acetyltransferase